ncbi:hypothetical protein SDRG_13547 [Saprolegnia diclina VS20]|uniref:Uncharacterized protein n=1 Tax=Saprolegnia diclina (strain VS20) TaxID=1156394 RepID=T0Q5G4_SAPDV|nr:hypothetical protein SDRG_13547 [Saprolegnia diclina VS20]EQC28670.1 hypothetical protein SDRG_13547 [Saprolegnia diclina VS20]|eukprot:XP_008617862.1 hypothetical protein SDRG_13547 [Saprolegnia diclina VS20]
MGGNTISVVLHGNHGTCRTNTKMSCVAFGGQVTNYIGAQTCVKAVPTCDAVCCRDLYSGSWTRTR